MTTTPYVIDDRERSRFLVNREVFVSEEIYRLERELFFDKLWTYVGHESEVPNRNDFHTRKVAGRPVIFTRDGRALVNTRDGLRFKHRKAILDLQVLEPQGKVSVIL